MSFFLQISLKWYLKLYLFQQIHTLNQKINFHFCPTCLKALCYAENSLSRSRVKVKVVWWCWGNVNELHAIRRWKKQYRCFEIIAQKISAKKYEKNLVFFRDEIKIFIISLFETRSRFVPSISRASRRDREFALSNLEFREGDEK